jgi:hypothetical protein
MQQWSNWEAVFSTWSVRQLRDATNEQLEELFSMFSMSRCYKQDKSTVYWTVRESPASKNVNTEAEEPTALEAVTRRQSVKTADWEYLVRAAMNCRECKSEIVL